MKKNIFIIVFIGTQIFFIFFYIHTQSRIIKLSYDKQKNEKTKNNLIQRKQELKQMLCATHNYGVVKQFALEKNMKQITLSQIKKIDNGTSL